MFSRDWRVEVPIIGEIDGKTVWGQMDVLSICDEVIDIADYKTGSGGGVWRYDLPISSRWRYIVVWYRNVGRADRFVAGCVGGSIVGTGGLVTLPLINNLMDFVHGREMGRKK